MRGKILWIACIFLTSNSFGQTEPDTSRFNKQVEHSIGVGFAITGFNSNFTYFVSPHYSFRYHRHWFGFTPFYGRLEPLAQQQDIGVGIDYRLYPFRNLNATLLYFPLGAHFNYKWTNNSQKTAMIYKAGFGVEAILGKRFALSLDANFGVGQTFSSKVQQTENSVFGTSNPISFYFLPTIRLSFGL